MDYHKFNTEEFLADETFQNWVKDGRKDDFIQTFVRSDEEQIQKVNQASAVLNTLKAKPHPPIAPDHIKSKWGQLEHILQEDTPATTPTEVRDKSSWIRYAAAVALLMLSYVGYWYWGQPIGRIEHTTPYATNSTILLKDGTEVTLNSNSTLQVAEDLQQGNEREVWLNGEGFFRVNKDTKDNRPFVVHAGGLDIVVLGTEFNVRYRDEHTLVALREGSIMMKARDKPELMMRPGQVWNYNQTKNEWRQEKRNQEALYAWLEHKIILDDTPLIDLTNTIETNFGLKVEILDASLKTSKLSGTIPDDDLDVIFDVIQELLEVKIDRDGKVVRIY
ncbi:FecR domain-containing protein [Reichenbachiella carrageenanivorans]|uniref:FecR domain-containing protein n=1 Tax=Reichenbachiella carrageenanivorans TaxID=2979869 RepID=A0ABY6D7Q8_9BACT|nr:FecR domain-containing protein [Reichenbachiella carrageenanivorans]UXX79880.1 FecR domain-containing protein [Reichenbachiella carrageenanivorans]